MVSQRTNVQQIRSQVEQLRREMSVRRCTVSQCATELIRYVQDIQREDALVVGFANDKINPYRPKSSFSCNLL